MGIASYNRGTRAMSADIDRQLQGSNARVAVVHPPAEPPVPIKPPVLGYWPLTDDPAGPAKVGERVFCTVTGCRGWYTVTESAKRGGSPQIKAEGFRGWGYAHNFTRKPADWQLR